MIHNASTDLRNEKVVSVSFLNDEVAKSSSKGCESREEGEILGAGVTIQLTHHNQYQMQLIHLFSPSL